MKKAISYSTLLFLILLTACATLPAPGQREEKSFRTVPSELTGVDWRKTPASVLSHPVKDEPIIWLGIIKNAFVTQKDGEIEIEWFCEHLSFAEPGPSAISVRPIKAVKGQGYFALSLIMNNMTKEQAMKFKTEHTASPHYILAGGKLSGIVEREGKQVPFLYTLRFGIGPKLAVLPEQK